VFRITGEGTENPNDAFTFALVALVALVAFVAFVVAILLMTAFRSMPFEP
jgi:uncharacterized membrane protein